MMIATLPKGDRFSSHQMTLEDFFNYKNDEEILYEFEDGNLIPMPAESETNRRVAMFILACFLLQGIPPHCLSMKTEIVTTGSRVRVPDLIVFSEELATTLVGAKRSMVLPNMPAPILVVEVVSPYQAARDYRYKRSEYAARGICEYWIVDPLEQIVIVLEWVEGLYEEKIYSGNDRVLSTIFKDLQLTVSEIFQS